MAKGIPINWQQLKTEMRGILIHLARMEKTISYSELAAQIRTATMHHRNPLFSRLWLSISDEDERAGRPTLATLIVNKTTQRPGDGYFKEAESAANGHFDREAYWLKRFNEVCDYWQIHDDEEDTEQ
jgi:hypothetical protein